MSRRHPFRRTAPLAVAALALLAASIAAPRPALAAQGTVTGSRGTLAEAERRYLDILAGGDAGLAPAALLGLSRVRLAGGDLAAALDAAQRLVAQYPAAPEAVEGRLTIAEAQLAQAGDRDSLTAARTAYEDALAAAPADAAWRLSAELRTAALDLALGDEDRAAGRLLAIVDRQPPSAERAAAHLALADLRLARGDWQTAAELIASPLAEAARYPAAAAGSLASLRRRAALLERLRIGGRGATPWRSATAVGGLSVKKPVAVAAADDGSLIVVDAGPDVALVWRDGAVAGRREVPKMGKPFWGPGGGAWVPSDDALVQVERGDRRTAVVSGVPVKRVEAGAGGLLGPYLVVSKPPRAAAFGSDLKSTHSFLWPPEGEPEDLDYLASGGLYVLDGKSSRVVRFRGDGAGETIVSGLDRPRALAVDRLGDVYVLERSGRIRVIAPDGKPLATLGPEMPGGQRLDDPQDLAVDGAGRLYVVDPKLSTVLVLE